MAKINEIIRTITTLIDTVIKYSRAKPEDRASAAKTLREHAQELEDELVTLSETEIQLIHKMHSLADTIEADKVRPERVEDLARQIKTLVATVDVERGLNLSKSPVEDLPQEDTSVLKRRPNGTLEILPSGYDHEELDTIPDDKIEPVEPIPVEVEFDEDEDEHDPDSIETPQPAGISVGNPPLPANEPRTEPGSVTRARTPAPAPEDRVRPSTPRKFGGISMLEDVAPTAFEHFPLESHKKAPERETVPPLPPRVNTPIWDNEVPSVVTAPNTRPFIDPDITEDEEEMRFFQSEEKEYQGPTKPKVVINTWWDWVEDLFQQMRGDPNVGKGEIDNTTSSAPYYEEVYSEDPKNMSLTQRAMRNPVRYVMLSTISALLIVVAVPFGLIGTLYFVGGDTPSYADEEHSLGDMMSRGKITVEEAQEATPAQPKVAKVNKPKPPPQPQVSEAEETVVTIPPKPAPSYAEPPQETKQVASWWERIWGNKSEPIVKTVSMDSSNSADMLRKEIEGVQEAIKELNDKISEVKQTAPAQPAPSTVISDETLDKIAALERSVRELNVRIDNELEMIATTPTPVASETIVVHQNNDEIEALQRELERLSKIVNAQKASWGAIPMACSGGRFMRNRVDNRYRTVLTLGAKELHIIDVQPVDGICVHLAKHQREAPVDWRCFSEEHTFPPGYCPNWKERPVTRR